MKHARNYDGSIADDLAQTVKKTRVGPHHRFTVWAGGFWNQVSADEYPDHSLNLHVGDRLRVLGNFEIHTATFPKSSSRSVPLITTQCEVPGRDTPATSPADCAAPTDFQLAFDNKAIMPTASNRLKSSTAFVNSGLLTYGSDNTFVARRPGTYTFVCLVHGPQMSETVHVS